jgi:hypothetical protein
VEWGEHGDTSATRAVAFPRYKIAHRGHARWSRVLRFPAMSPLLIQRDSDSAGKLPGEGVTLRESTSSEDDSLPPSQRQEVLSATNAALYVPTQVKPVPLTGPSSIVAPTLAVEPEL